MVSFRFTVRFRVLPAILISSFLTYAEACRDVEIVPRAHWGSRNPKWTVPISTPVKHVFIGHTVTQECRDKQQCSSLMRSMQNYHMSTLGWSDIGYNFAVGGDGRVYEGVGWTREGVHTFGWNRISQGIGFIGNFMHARPNNKMLRAARKLIVCGIQEGYIYKDRAIHGARDGTCTKSPGDVLYDIIRQWPSFVGGPLLGYRCG